MSNADGNSHPIVPGRTPSAAFVLAICMVFMQGLPLLELDVFGFCALFLVDTEITDNGDGDGIADTSETLQIGISLQPRCDEYSPDGLRNCVALLSTESPAIDCMRRAEIFIGDLPVSGPAVTSDETFEIKIGNIDRHDLGLGPNDPLQAAMTVDVRCEDGSYTRWVDGPFTLPLDLNALDQGQTPIVWGEDFEDGGFDPSDPLQGTAFFAENLDAGLSGNNNAEGLINSNGWRCQYSDPDWHNAMSYNHAQGEVCYPTMNLAQANAIFWQLDGSLVADSPDGGRAHRGEQSLYYGIFVGHTDENFTTPLSTIESVATVDLINLGAGSPRLSFWQQISLGDYRSCCTNSPIRSLDRGVAQIQLHDSDGVEISPWMNLQPIQNCYQQRSEDNFFNCFFDPIDDGNNEDDYFDPTDPDRRYGPSSTCYPTYTWSFQGSTTGAFSTQNLGYATTPPDESDAPSLGLGTWVESVVDLSEFRGRRARLRFLVSSFKATAESHLGQFGPDRDEREDGWWIDDIVIDETLSEPATVVNDLFLLGSCTGSGQSCIGQCRASLDPCSDSDPCDEGEGDCVLPCPPGEVCAGAPPDCGANCTIAEANLFVEPDGPLNPESVTVVETLSSGDDYVQVDLNLAAPFDSATGAEPSWVDVCVDGHREYRACISGDPDGDLSGLPDADCDDAWDRPICESCAFDWSLEPRFHPVPGVVTTYAMEVRCSSVPDCRDARALEIVVECASGDPNTRGLRAIQALNKQTLTWHGPLDVDWLRGSFVSGSEIGDYVADFNDVVSFATSVPMDGDPPAGTGHYYLVKANGPVPPVPFQWYRCDTATWRSGGLAEVSEPARNNAFGEP